MYSSVIKIPLRETDITAEGRHDLFLRLRLHSLSYEMKLEIAHFAILLLRKCSRPAFVNIFDLCRASATALVGSKPMQKSHQNRLTNLDLVK